MGYFRNGDDISLVYTIRLKLLRWIVFNILLSMIPIMFVYLNSYITIFPIRISQVVSNGELFIISCSLLMTASGELVFNFSRDSDYLLWKTFVLGMSIMFGLLAGFLFASMASESIIHPSSVKYSEQRVFDISSFLFLISVCLSCSAVMLSEVP